MYRTRTLQCIVRCSNSTLLCPGATKISIRRQYFVHATDHDLHRMIAFVENTPEGNINSYTHINTLLFSSY